ncbi:hypothetical protein A0J61_11264, partial [Choanephora cucurbitarum]
AFASIRVGVQSVAPIREIDFHGSTTGFGIADGCVPVDEENAPPNRAYAKLKFNIFKYAWKNWSNEALVRKRENLREAFTDHLKGLYDDLVEAKLATPNASPILLEQRKTRDARSSRSARRGTI